MKNPLISVIIPVYNIMDCLERCVASVCALAGKEARIRVFHKPNGGSSSARNYGIERARGEYLGFVDSDDFVEPDMYASLAEQALKGGWQIVQVSRDELD